MLNVEDCLKVPYVQSCIEVYALKLSQTRPKTLSFDDARQELTCRLLERIDKYNPDKSSISTFAVTVVQRIAYNILRSNKLKAAETYVRVHETIMSAVEESHESRTDAKIMLDDLEKELLKPTYHRAAYKIVRWMRGGVSKSGCAEMIGCSRSLINWMFRTHIKGAAQKMLGID